MLTCSQCGADNPRANPFCQGCGGKLSAADFGKRVVLGSEPARFASHARPQPAPASGIETGPLPSSPAAPPGGDGGMLSLAFVAVWIPVFIIVSLIVTALRVGDGFVTYGDLIGGGVFGFFAAGAVAGWATKDA